MSLRFVVVGPGLIGKKHIALINANADTRLVAIVAPDHAHNRKVAESERLPMYGTLEECAQLSPFDAAIIASPNPFHFEHARWCIERRIAVLIEKPITAELTEAKSLVELVNRHQSKAMVGHHRAHSPLLSLAKEIINSGRLGRMVSVIGSAQFYKPRQYFVDGPWRTKLGGGPILINLIHEIGNMRSLMGEIVAVQGLASSTTRQFDVEDTVVVSFSFASGALGSFVLSDTAATPMSWEQTTQENPAYPSYDDVDCYLFSGTLGFLGFPTMRLRHVPESTEASWWHPLCSESFTVEREDPLRSQLAHFVDVIKHDIAPRVSVLDGYQNLRVIEAIKQAIQSGQIVHIGD